jgi:hypothetical protein
MKKSIGPVVAAVLAMALVCLLSVTLAGCGMLGDPAEEERQRSLVRAELDAAKAALAEEKGRYSKLLEEAARTGSAGDAEKAQKTLGAIAALEKRAAEAEAMLAKVTRGDGSVDLEKAGRELSVYLPFPFNILALPALAIGGRWVERELAAYRQKQRTAAAQAEARELEAAAKSIVNSVDVARMRVPGLAAAMAESKSDIRHQLTDRAKTLLERERLT